MNDSKKIYESKEFGNWAYPTGLIEDEATLISKYFKKNLATLEAGTGGGRILHALRDLGYNNLHGFDYVPEFIKVARARDQSSRIEFKVQDATQLDYSDDSFDQIIYLQQILSALGSHSRAVEATKEANRILKPGGIAIFSFLDISIRQSQMFYRAYLKYLGSYRRIKRKHTPINLLPWLKLDNKINFGAFIDKPPYNYWFTPNQALDLLTYHGFKPIAIYSSTLLSKHSPAKTIDDYHKQGPHRGKLYITCTK